MECPASSESEYTTYDLLIVACSGHHATYPTTDMETFVKRQRLDNRHKKHHILGGFFLYVRVIYDSY